MRFSNIHAHTIFSDGKHTIKENIESAILKNMETIGFSDHSFTACDTSYCMMESDYDAYIKSIAQAKNEYKNQINVLCGIEKDYYSTIDNSAFDYVIASIHYIIKDGVCHPIDHSPQQQKDCISAFNGNVLDMAKCYYDMVVEHAQMAKPHVIGHFDVINKFSLMPEDDQTYMRIATESLTQTAKYCNVFEVNTGAISRGWRKTPYPSDYLLRHLNAIGGKVVLNSDSHHKDNIDYFFPQAVQIIKNAGFKYILTPTPNGFIEREI